MGAGKWGGGTTLGAPVVRGEGVPHAPPVGLGGCPPRGMPRAPGTKRLWQPHRVNATVSRDCDTAGVGSGPVRAWHRGCHGAGTPVVLDHLWHRGAAGRSASTQLVPSGRWWCQPGLGATAASRQLDGSRQRPSPLPGPLGSWKMPGNGEPPSLIWLRRAGSPPAPLGRLPDPAPPACPPSPLPACCAVALGKRRGPCLVPRLPRRNVQQGWRSRSGEKIPPPLCWHWWLSTTLAPASVSPG